MQVKREITNFFQNIGESFAQAWGRFSGLLMRVPNHGFMDLVILQYFYGGLNDESKQMVDACAGGTLNSLTYKEAVKLFAERALNDEQYNPLGEVELKKGMLFITPELMPAVKKSMKEKGIPTKLAIESKTNELHAMVVENDLDMEMKKCWYQQTEFKELMFRQLTLHKSDINALAGTLEDLSHATKHLSKHLDMVQVQCDQIAKAQALILSQKDFSKAISTNVVTRRGTETQEPTGPVWYQEE